MKKIVPRRDILMEKSKVYFTTMKTTLSENLPQKLKRLILAAGMDQIDFDGKYTAIKMHFGEPGNLAFLRPNYAAVVVNTVKELGGKPFLTDCNTLYVGGRKNALDHLDSAYQNGFSPFSTVRMIILFPNVSRCFFLSVMRQNVSSIPATSSWQ